MLLISHFSYGKTQLENEAIQIANVYATSLDYIFSQQPLINSQNSYKDKLFGTDFINHVAEIYKSKFDQPLPPPNSDNIKLLYQTMIEVMEDNRTLLLDPDIRYKGFIPVIYAFQLSQKFVQKGAGIKLKFTNKADRVRNMFNAPSPWEQSAIAKVESGDNNSVLETSVSGQVNYLVRVEMAPFCLNCHGKPQDNPLNKDKEPRNWTDKDITGYKMENWNMQELGGAISVIINQ